MEYTIIGYRDIDCGVGPPYYPCMVREFLMKSYSSLSKRNYFVTMDITTCKTWITDSVANEIMKSPDFKKA